MHQWKQRESAKCPRCDDEEDAKHVWVCQGEGVDAVWSCALQKLHRWMIEQKTLPNLADVICDRLSAWRSNSLPSVEVTGFLGLRGTVEAQDRVGWRALLEGLPVPGWAEVQHRFYLWMGIRKTGERWVVALIHKVWEVAWDLWDHRNRVLHDSDTSLIKQQREQEIMAQFEAGAHSVTAEARVLFRQGVTAVLALPPEAQQAWLIRIHQARVRFGQLQEER